MECEKKTKVQMDKARSMSQTESVGHCLLRVTGRHVTGWATAEGDHMAGFLCLT